MEKRVLNLRNRELVPSNEISTYIVTGTLLDTESDAAIVGRLFCIMLSGRVLGEFFRLVTRFRSSRNCRASNLENWISSDLRQLGISSRPFVLISRDRSVPAAGSTDLCWALRINWLIACSLA